MNSEKKNALPRLRKTPSSQFSSSSFPEKNDRCKSKDAYPLSAVFRTRLFREASPPRPLIVPTFCFCRVLDFDISMKNKKKLRRNDGVSENKNHSPKMLALTPLINHIDDTAVTVLDNADNFPAESRKARDARHFLGKFF